MKYLDKHSHSYKGDWPFEFEDNLGVVTTKYVMNEEHPIIEVMHWDDGDWQFMCGTTENPDDGMVVCIGCLFTKFPWVSKFANLPRGQIAYLENEKWVTENLE